MKNLSIKKLIEKLEYSNIQVTEYKANNKLCGYELNTYTDCGVNQIIFLDFRADGKNIKDPKEFIAEYNERINDIDIDEEININRQNTDYCNNFSLEVSIKDFKDWKENLLNIFSEKTPQQRQFEQVVDKFRSQLEEMQETIKMMPIKDNVSEGCQRTFIATQINNLDYAINGITLEDFTPNEYSGDFKLSYS
jgi:hypothetical protein